MKNGPLVILGLFVALTLSWAGVVLGSHAQLGGLTPYFDEGEGQSFPNRLSGIAARGQLVYADLGCAACHTQQVRRADFGSDQARGWGERQSVARDYIFQSRPQLGASRFGPDLTNVSAHKPPLDAEKLINLLYGGSPTHPAYKFLFEDTAVVGQRSVQALNLTGSNAPAEGHQVVPTERATSLVAYLLNPVSDFVYPEARPFVAPKAANAEHGAAPAANAEHAAAPAAKPEEKAENPKK